MRTSNQERAKQFQLTSTENNSGPAGLFCGSCHGEQPHRAHSTHPPVGPFRCARWGARSPRHPRPFRFRALRLFLDWGLKEGESRL